MNKPLTAIDRLLLFLKNISEIGLLSMPLTPLIIHSISAICWVLSIIWLVIRHGKKSEPGSEKLVLLLLLITGNFLFYLLSLGYSEDTKEGVAYLIVQLPMLIFPLGFYLWSKMPDEMKKATFNPKMIFFAFVCALCFINLYLFARNGMFNNFDKVNSFESIYRDYVASFWGKHPTYLSLYMGFGLLILMTKVKNGKAGGKVIGILFSLVVLLNLFLLASRGPILALLLSMGVWILISVKKRWNKAFVLLGAVIAFVVILSFVPAAYSRFKEVFHTSFSPPVGLEFNSTNLRAGILECSMSVIGENPITGVGVGDVQHELQVCYSGFPTEAYTIQTYNSHNQYLQFGMATGLPSLIFFLCVIILMFIKANSSRNGTFLLFMTFMSFCFLTENILSRQAGIMFYYFFAAYFLFNHDNKLPEWKSALN